MMWWSSGLLLLLLPALANAAQDDPKVIPHFPPLRVRRLIPSHPDRDCLQFGCDPQQPITGRKLTKENVSKLAPDWSVTLPETADTTPAYLTGIRSGQTTHDVLVVSTMAGRTLAFDARNGELLWTTTPPLGPRWTTSSPAVDPSRRNVYSCGLDGYIHKYNVSTGSEVTGDGWPQLLTLKPDVEKCSSPLTIATSAGGLNYLYAAIAAYPDPGDDGDYQGHVVAVDLDTNKQIVFNALCSDQQHHLTYGDCSEVQAGIWARAGVVYDPDTDRVFVTTGNGKYDADLGGFNWGTSVLALRPDLSTDNGAPIDSYTPVDFQHLTDEDLDLSSTTVAILPRKDDSQPHLAVQGGKDSRLRLLNLDDLSGQSGPRHVGGEIEIVNVPQGWEVHTHPATWLAPDGNAWVFVGTGGGVSGLMLDLSEEKPHLVTKWMISGGASSPILSNGVLYVAHSNSLRALDPETGAVLWSTDEIGPIHWQTPLIAGGRLYICDARGNLYSFAVPVNQ
jgi:outer membrane protein assembly factor BamB